MMTLSQSATENPAHICPPLPDTEHKGKSLIPKRSACDLVGLCSVYRVLASVEDVWVINGSFTDTSLMISGGCVV